MSVLKYINEDIFETLARGFYACREHAKDSVMISVRKASCYYYHHGHLISGMHPASHWAWKLVTLSHSVGLGSLHEGWDWLFIFLQYTLLK
jgi:hypothetical protein